jgi:hypothetical protein
MEDHSGHSKLKLVMIVLMCMLIAAYVSSYIILSRRGFATSNASGCSSFYFFPPEDTNAWRRMNYGCVYFYYPLIVIDNWIGTGKPIAHEPMWRITARNACSKFTRQRVHCETASGLVVAESRGASTAASHPNPWPLTPSP